MASIITNVLSGLGIQNFGNVRVEGDLHIGSSQPSDKDNEALAALRITNPRTDKTRIEEDKGGLLEDCYKWILSNDDYRQWYTGSENRLLWIRGDAGKGKTMLICGIIKELERAPERAGHCTAYFFCQATDARLNNAIGVLRGLLYLLLDQNRPLVSLLRQELDHAGQNLFQDGNAWHSLSQLLLQVLDDSRLPRRTILIIDGLDECSTDLDRLMGLLMKVIALGKVKVLVSSRNWPEVAEGLSAIPEIIPLRLELNEASISEAVDWYIRVKVEDLSKTKKYDTQLRRTVHQYLVKNSNATFLWVALVWQELAKLALRNWNAEKQLREFPAGLDSLYTRMMNEISKSKDRDLCGQVLKVVSIVFRPVSLAELAYLVDDPAAFSYDGSLNQVIELCRSLIVLRQDGSVSFIHQSAKDFLVGNESTSEYVSLKGHETIVLRSLEIMSRTLKRNIYRLSHPGDPAVPFNGPEDPLSASRYSCVFWINHLMGYLEGSTVQDMHQSNDLLEDEGAVHDFVKKHFLHWLESISLLKSMALPIGSLVRLNRFAAQLQDDLKVYKALSLIRDATRLARYHWEGIEAAPLQVYMSGLAFSPTIARRELFQYEEPQPVTQWISQTPTDDKWQNSVDLSVGSIAISPDGTRLASSTYGEVRFGYVPFPSTVRLWDTATGSSKTILHHGARLLIFSPNGNLLASVSEGSTINIWNITMGTCQTLNGVEVAVIAFSDDSQRLITVSTSGTVTYWNLETAEREESLLLPATGDRWGQVVVLGNGKRVAELSANGEVNIWSPLAGKCELVLKQHPSRDHRPGVIAASGGGQWLAVGYHDSTAISLWETIAPSFGERTLEGHRKPVMSLDFNQAGTRLASGSLDGVLKVWNVASGACEHTLTGFKGRISSVDPLVMASVSDTLIELWDISGRWDTPPKQSNDKFVAKRPVLSASGDWAASIFSGEQGYLIQLWKIGTGKSWETIQMPHCESEGGVFVEFSPDGQSVACSVSDPDTKYRGKVLDLATRRQRSAISFSNDTLALCELKFSSSGKFVAFVTLVKDWDLKLSLWSTDSERCIHEQTLRFPKLLINRAAPIVLDLVCSDEGAWAVLTGSHIEAFGWVIPGKTATLETSTPSRYYTGELDYGCNICAAAFSSDWLRVATADTEGTVKLWDTMTGQCKGAVTLKWPFQHFDCVSFLGTGLDLRTRWGILDLRKLIEADEGGHSVDLNSSIEFRGYGVSEDCRWILRDSRRFLWLPPDYQPDYEPGDSDYAFLFDVQGSTIVMANRSRGVFFLQFPEGPLKI